MKRTLLSLMLLVLPAVKMKDSKTDRHKRAFWDLLQLQEAASPSKFATWQWWSACLMRWCVSPQVCARWRAPQTQLGVCSKTRRLSDNIISVSVSVCITSAFFSILPLSPAPPLPFRLSLLTGGTGGRVFTGKHTSYIPSVMSQRQINVLGWRYALLLGDNGGRA